MTSKAPTNTFINNEALTGKRMLEIIKNTYLLVKNNLGLCLLSILVFRFLYEINFLPFPVYRNILFIFSAALWTTLMIRRFSRLRLFTPETYLAVVYSLVLFFILWILAEILIILILFLPAELMFLKFWDFQEWRHFVFSKYLFNTLFMSAVKSIIWITSSFFSALFLMKLIGIAAENEITFRSLLKRSKYLIFPAVLSAGLFSLPANASLTSIFLIVIISAAFATFQKIAATNFL